MKNVMAKKKKKTEQAKTQAIFLLNVLSVFLALFPKIKSNMTV